MRLVCWSKTWCRKKPTCSNYSWTPSNTADETWWNLCTQEVRHSSVKHNRMAVSRRSIEHRVLSETVVQSNYCMRVILICDSHCWLLKVCQWCLIIPGLLQTAADPDRGRKGAPLQHGYAWVSMGCHDVQYPSWFWTEYLDLWHWDNCMGPLQLGLHCFLVTTLSLPFL